MSMFDDNIDGTPVTAQLLKNILAERRIQANDSKVVRYEKILNHILKLVRYDMDKELWEYKISLEVLGITSPFDSGYTAEINKLIDEGMNTSSICRWIDEHPIQLSNELNDFVEYFKKRGFQLSFCTATFLESKNRTTDKVIIISWK